MRSLHQPSYQIAFAAEDSEIRHPKHKQKIQSLDGGRFCRFLFPFVDVAAKLRHRKILGESIRSCRKGAGLSQEKLAEKAELHHNYIGEIERGEKAASIDTIVKVAKAVGMRPSDLVRNL